MSMFREKTDPNGSVSMTRVVAFLFALTVCAVLVILAWRAEQPDGPLAFVAIVTLLAVPIQALLRGRKGAEIVTALFNRFGVGFQKERAHGTMYSADYAPPPGFQTDADYNEGGEQ